MIGACGHYLDGANEDLCTACAAKVVNVETPMHVVLGYDAPDYNGDHDMTEWRHLVPGSPMCPRCGKPPLYVEHMGGGQKGEEFICGPCGAIIIVTKYGANGSYNPADVIDTGKTAMPIPTWRDEDYERDEPDESPAIPTAPTISYEEWRKRFEQNIERLRNDTDDVP